MSEDHFQDRPIAATPLNETQRMLVLPELFGKHMMRFEAYVYGWMGKLARDYDGGYWEMYRLSNGGFYMAPASQSAFVVGVDTNGFEGELSANATGVVVTLFALNQLAWERQIPGSVDLYYCLKDYAAEHAEASLIYRAID